MAMFNAFSLFAALTSAIALYATYLGTDEAKWSVYVAAAFCLVIAVHQSFALGYAIELKLRHSRARNAPDQGAAPETPRQPEPRALSPVPDDGIAPSVTEHTTDLLPVERSRH